MSEKIEIRDANNIFSEKISNVKQEIEDYNYLDDKLCVSKTCIDASSLIGIGNNFERDVEFKIYETASAKYIKEELSLSEIVCNTMNVKNKICATEEIKIESDNQILFYEHCHEYYQDYCTKCGMLVHVLNRNNRSNACNTAGEGIPNKILEIKKSSEHFGIFVLKIIPKGVRFGPFTGLSLSNCSLKLNLGKFIVSKDDIHFLNWMQYINPAKDIYEKNLLPFQYESNLYYRTTREIQVGEELLVYFGKEYEDKLNEGIEIKFVPNIEKDVGDVFACTFCCLGFSSSEYLTRHKNICPNDTTEKFLSGELTQCPFCNIYLDEKEYIEYHMTYCYKRNIRKCIPLALHNKKVEVSRRKTQRLQMYKCTDCNYKSSYKADLKDHINKHYKGKIYKCVICYRRFKTKESLKMHVGKIHIDCEEKVSRKDSITDPTRAHIKTIYPRVRLYPHGKLKQLKCEFQAKDKYYMKSHINAKHFKKIIHKCSSCKFKMSSKSNLKKHIKTVHLKEFNYECALCKFKTNYKSHLNSHMKTKHLQEFNYTCEHCNYKTNYNWNLEKHTKTKHLQEFDYNCELCEYKTNYKTHLTRHIKTEHLKEFDYVCEFCEYKTSRKMYLEAHIKAKHLKVFGYKCDLCEYETSRKLYLESHIKKKHLEEFDYRCDLCQYKTNFKSNLQSHKKNKHLKEYNHKCVKCEYTTNYKSNLKIHMKNQHLKEFTYKCASCKYNTNSKLNLERHTKTRKHLNR